MKQIALFSIIFNTVLSVVVIYLLLSKSNDLSNPTIVVNLDSTYVKQQLKTLNFDVSKLQQKIVYVPQKAIERHYKEKQPINNYYSDSTTIINNHNDNAIQAIKTTDTIQNKDGSFVVSALSPTPLYDLKLDYELNQLQITKTVIPKHQFFVGANIGTNKGFNQFKISAEVQYILKGNNGFKYEFERINGVNYNSVGYLKRIEFRR